MASLRASGQVETPAQGYAALPMTALASASLDCVTGHVACSRADTTTSKVRSGLACLWMTSWAVEERQDPYLPLCDLEREARR